MKTETQIIEIASLKIKFQKLLNIVDNAIRYSKPIQIHKTFLKQKNNNVEFLKWLHKHKIVELLFSEKSPIKTVSIKSRKKKLELSLQLKALGASIKDIAERFNVKTATAQGYLKNLGQYDRDYLNVLKLILSLKQVTILTSLTSLPEFPIRIKTKKIKENISASDFKNLGIIAKKSKWIQFVTGQNLGTSDLSILLPK